MTAVYNGHLAFNSFFFSFWLCHAACRILVLGPRIEPVPPTLEACVHAQSLSCVQFFAAPWTVACQAPLSMEFFRQEYWALESSWLQFQLPCQITRIIHEKVLQ